MPYRATPPFPFPLKMALWLVSQRRQLRCLENSVSHKSLKNVLPPLSIIISRL